MRCYAKPVFTNLLLLGLSSGDSCLLLRLPASAPSFPGLGLSGWQSILPVPVCAIVDYAMYRAMSKLEPYNSRGTKIPFEASITVCRCSQSYRLHEGLPSSKNLLPHLLQRSQGFQMQATQNIYERTNIVLLATCLPQLFSGNHASIFLFESFL